MYQIVDEISKDRVDQVEVNRMANEFRLKSNELRQHLKEKFNDLKMVLKIQEQKAEMILKKNLSFIEAEISKMQKVPARLFEDADNWAKAARSKLDKFEENMDKPNFINYDLLEIKDTSGGPDIINFGESLVTELEEHKDISMVRVANQIKQLGISFNHEVIGKLKDVVSTEVIEGVQIDETELASMEEMMREASSQDTGAAASNIPGAGVQVMRTATSNLSDAAPITRSSLAKLTGDDNDLLSESPVFQQASQSAMHGATDLLRPIANQPPVSPRKSAQLIAEVPEDPLDEHLVNEINDYLTGIMEDGTNLIDMAQSPIKSQGAECVAAAINFCESVTEVRLASCEIRDSGAIKLFMEFAKSKKLEIVDLSGNPLTERVFDSIETCLNANSQIRQVLLQNINVKSNFAWGKFKKFGSIVQH